MATFLVKTPLEILVQMYHVYMVSSAHSGSKSRTICNCPRYVTVVIKGYRKDVLYSGYFSWGKTFVVFVVVKETTNVFLTKIYY